MWENPLFPRDWAQFGPGLGRRHIIYLEIGAAHSATVLFCAQRAGEGAQRRLVGGRAVTLEDNKNPRKAA